MKPKCSAIVEVFSLKQRSRLFACSSRKLNLPQLLPGSRLFLLRDEDGERGLHPVPAGERRVGIPSEKALAVRVFTNSRPMEISFAAVLEDDKKQRWDLLLKGSWSVTDSARFLSAYGLSMLCPGDTVSAQIIESWIANSISHRVRDAVRGQHIGELRLKDSLPARWWETQVNNWLTDFGLSLAISAIQWQSAEDAAWQAEQARLKDLARIEKERDRQRQAELREAAQNAEYERGKAEIEVDLRMSSQEKAHELRLLEERHRKELIAVQTEAEDARRAAERASLEHEVMMARLRDDLEAAQNARARLEEGEAQHSEIINELARMREALEKIAKLPGNLLVELASGDERRSHQIAERSVSPEFGLGLQPLAALGFSVAPQTFVQGLREKAAADGDPIVIQKKELTTRDVRGIKVKGLPINTSLQFELATSKEGCIVILNIGTSGAIRVHVPNAYVGLGQAKVSAGKSYFAPGPELLPWERLSRVGLDYMEIGPPGWEHIAVVVSDEPLIGQLVLGRSSAEAPFVKLSAEELQKLCSELGSRDPVSWSAGVLSFLVG